MWCIETTRPDTKEHHWGPRHCPPTSKRNFPIAFFSLDSAPLLMVEPQSGIGSAGARPRGSEHSQTKSPYLGSSFTRDSSGPSIVSLGLYCPEYNNRTAETRAIYTAGTRQNYAEHRCKSRGEPGTRHREPVLLIGTGHRLFDINTCPTGDKYVITTGMDL